MAKKTKDKLTNEEKMMSDLRRTLDLLQQAFENNQRYNVNYDDEFETISKRNISTRDDSYTDLLNHFIKITKARNLAKEIHKWIYFWIIMILVILFGRSIFSLISKIELSDVNCISDLVIVISCLASFSSVIISIPLIITKYLFSSKEDKNIAKIILHTQQHDLSGKRMIETSTRKENGSSSEKEPNSDIVEIINEEVKKRIDNSVSIPDMGQIFGPYNDI